MRIANLNGRAKLLIAGGVVDIAEASRGEFGPDPMSIYPRWADFVAWAGDETGFSAMDYRVEELGPPIPRPRQVFAIGLNYAEHAAETGMHAAPDIPALFTKFATSLTGPVGDIALSGPSVDWEVELVVVIGREAVKVTADEAWCHVAGVTVGQDFSDRDVQMSGACPQFSLGKSFPGYGPTGPVLVTLDEVAAGESLRLRCWVNDELVQDDTTDQMLVPVPELIERISAICTLYPGDLIFTGTPSGVGMGRIPARYLRVGDVVRTRIDGIGEMTHRFVIPTTPGTEPCR
ncbi:fumarylacetoacetate hydrolase family protein [Mycobacterium sp. 21AC1]|uniref:fumarylacetoacetate hydrolase family protein n=1 Tax=[Mycobacterium] appelbergii TaxID=2939269 RepID=UPI002938FD91|nr:fumarylacetoacetate hydrolase family protein [Mycobacterium sp. 21AC1]MDV3130245.1 fumarylacetoacetate hydrolase family protein [Mycobacterium sp. 21AC1]